MPTLNRDACQRLDQIADALGLTDAEIGSLFNIQRQSIIGWREHGIPQARRATIERLYDLAKVLQREIIPTRIPEIVRTKDEWLGNRTILETIRAEGPEAVYAYLKRLFSYGAA
jgi:transcriptional regulator with XRE-family HTH domain